MEINLWTKTYNNDSIINVAIRSKEEFDKVNTFFKQQEDEFIHQFNDIKQKVVAMSEICKNSSSKSLKDAISEDSPRLGKFSDFFYNPSIIKKRMINNVAIIYFDSPTPLHFLSMFMLHRMIGIPILLLWYFGILLYVTSGKNINLFLILGWDARTNITHYHILFVCIIGSSILAL
ncbi:hypothetical protein ACTFIY_001262 [Dictyostelium cf. discoideum]